MMSWWEVRRRRRSSPPTGRQRATPTRISWLPPQSSDLVWGRSALHDTGLVRYRRALSLGREPPTGTRHACHSVTEAVWYAIDKPRYSYAALVRLGGSDRQ